MDVVLVAVVIVALVALGVAAALMWRRQRSERLQQDFGAEYDRTVEDTGDTSSAEKELAHRQKRRSQFEVVPLSRQSADGYRDEWNSLQVRFVDEPEEAVEAADSLVVRIMAERGYPVDDFDNRADDLSVDHPHVVQHYRAAHGVAVAQSRGQADTEQMRQAVTSYRALVDALLADSGSGSSRPAPSSTDPKEQR